MRSIAILPISFLAGLGVGFAVFQRPVPPARSAAKAPPGQQSSAAAADSLTRGASSTDGKAQRLLAAALRKGREIDRLSELYLAIQAITAEDFRRLLLDAGALKAMIEKLQGVDWEIGRHMASGLIDRWLAVDPDMVITWAPRVLELIPKKEQGRSLVLDALAERRPEELLAMVASRKGPEERAEIISRALRELASKDLTKAQAWLNACTDPADRRVAEKALRLGIVKADPLRAIELASTIDNRQDSYNLLRTAAEQAGKMGVGMSRQLATMPMKGWMLSSLLEEFAERDPELAVDLALKTLSDSDTNAQAFSLRSAFASLAHRDPAQAISKLDGLSGSPLASAVSAIGEAWASRDPTAALAWLGEKPAEDRTSPQRWGFGSSDSLLYTFSDWFAVDRNAARAWAEALPAGETREKVQIQMARVLAHRGDAAEATQVLSRLGRAADPKALSDIAGAWARSDPQAAADWAIAQPAGPIQGRALASVVGTWANEDALATRNWLAQFPPGEARDRSIAAFLSRSSSWTDSVKNQVAEFDAWFDLIDDPWQRAVVARKSYWTRREKDPKGAHSWLSSLQNVDSAVIRMTLRNAGDD